jgi:two-component system sensor histidine kinase KdpD
LLRAVSHDLRTPLTSAKAAIGSLRASDVEFSAEDRQELLAAADESLDRLTQLVDNLLDMSRLQAGALGIALQPTSVTEVISLALRDLGPASSAIKLVVPDELPDVNADPALLERIIANLLSNAVRYGPPDSPPAIVGCEQDDRIEIRIIDDGPGIPVAERDNVFQPFQRLGDRDNTSGVGLGLALSRGLAEAMGGTLEPHSTPGGGLTMVLSLPLASRELAEITE